MLGEEGVKIESRREKRRGPVWRREGPGKVPEQAILLPVRLEAAMLCQYGSNLADLSDEHGVGKGLVWMLKLSLGGSEWVKWSICFGGGMVRGQCSKHGVSSNVAKQAG